MASHEFDESAPELPAQSRLGRRAESDRDEAIEARKTGLEFDEEAQKGAAEYIASDLRNYLITARNDVLNPGSIDGKFILELGPDIAMTPDIIDVIADETAARKKRSRSTEERDKSKIRVEEMLDTWRLMEQRMDEREQTEARAGYLIARGFKPEEIKALMHEDPNKLRTLKRLIDSPPATEYSERLADKAALGETFRVDEVLGRLVAIISFHNREQIKLDEGDPIVMSRRLRDRRVWQVLGEASTSSEKKQKEPDDQ